MNTTTYQVATSRAKMERLFQSGECNYYHRISGNERRGTYLCEYRQGATFPLPNARKLTD